MSATLHGSAPAKQKTSATLHGNARADVIAQMGPPKRVPQKHPKPFILHAFGRFLEPHANTYSVHSKKQTIQSGCQRALMAMTQNSHSTSVV